MWKPNTTNVGIIVQLIIYIFGKFNQYQFLLLLFSLLNSYFKCDYNDIFKDIFDKILIKTTRKNQQFSQSISISGCRIRNGNGSGFSISGPDPRAKTLGPDPVRLLDEFFFFGARTCPSWALRAPRASLGCGASGPILWPNKKKKNVCLVLIFSPTKQEGKKKNQENPLFSQQPIDLTNRKPTKPIIFSTTNRLETLFHYNIFPHQK